MNQKIIFNILYQTIISDKEEVFFLEEFDNIGKIFLINLILMKIQCEDITLIIVFFNIIVTLLNKEIMIHSQFKILIDINSDSIYNISVQNYLIELI